MYSLYYALNKRYIIQIKNLNFFRLIFIIIVVIKSNYVMQLWISCLNIWRIFMSLILKATWYFHSRKLNHVSSILLVSIGYICTLGPLWNILLALITIWSYLLYFILIFVPFFKSLLCLFSDLSQLLVYTFFYY